MGLSCTECGAGLNFLAGKTFTVNGSARIQYWTCSVCNITFKVNVRFTRGATIIKILPRGKPTETVDQFYE